MYDAGEHTVQEIADTFGLSRPTIYRHLDPAKTGPAPSSTRAPRTGEDVASGLDH